ncbi:MAG: hypothetical protein ACR2NB_13960 [Solirubrobacteraceae bacterium]
MSPELDGALRTGPEYLCLDAGPLINFNDIRATEQLGEWLAPVAYTPRFVINQELGGRPKQNAPTISAPWLGWVPSHPDDNALVTKLVLRFGKAKPENQGEAEVIAACMRYGWTAVLDDEDARAAAFDEGVPSVYTVTLLAAAAAQGLITPTQGWKMHRAIETTDENRFSPLKPDHAYKEVFVDFANKLRKLWLHRGQPDWPLLLAAPELDDMLLILLADFRV